MTRPILLIIIAIAMLIIAPQAGYSGKVQLNPQASESNRSKDWGEEVRENASNEEGKERREDRRDERQEDRRDERQERREDFFE